MEKQKSDRLLGEPRTEYISTPPYNANTVLCANDKSLCPSASNRSDNSSSAIPAPVQFRKALYPLGISLAGRSLSWDAAILIIFKTDL